MGSIHQHSLPPGTYEYPHPLSVVLELRVQALPQRVLIWQNFGQRSFDVFLALSMKLFFFVMSIVKVEYVVDNKLKIYNTIFSSNFAL